MIFQPIQILYVEDDSDDVLFVREGLDTAVGVGFRLESVGSISKALDRLNGLQPDVILLDLNLPDSHGIQTVTSIVENYPLLPVVVLSSESDFEYSLSMLQAGAQDYLVKGETNPETLSRSLKYAIKRKHLHLKVMENEAQVRNLIVHISDGLMVVSQSGLICYTNPASEALFGRSASQLIGANFGFPISPDNKTLLEILRGQDENLAVEMRVSAIHWRGEPAHLVSLRDISERKYWEDNLLASNQALENSRQQLQTANRLLEKAACMKDEFLASMSHELRTPLTGILGLSEALQLPGSGPLTDKQRIAIGHINTSGQHLLELITDILDLSKLQAEMVELQWSTCSLNSICRASLQLTNPLAVAKHLHYSYASVPENITLRADERRLKQILVNLLSNAIKFTPNGGQYGIEAQADPGSCALRITVWDTGIGIREEDQQRLFQQFVQLDSSLSRQYAGTGLGLSLVRKLTEFHGGSVSVTSTVGSGSRFTVSLPWQPVVPTLNSRAV